MRGRDSSIGLSDLHQPRPVAGEGADGGMVPGAPSLPPDYRTRFAKVNRAPLVSHGHASGRWEVDVWVNDAAAKSLAARSRAVPEGAIAVAEHFERTANGRGAAGPIMVMEKRSAGFAARHGDWRWVVVGSRGQLVQDGVVESCAGCHDESPMDGLFPIVE
jgi:hypothetical protein